LLSSCNNGSETSPTATISPFKQIAFQDGFDSQNGNWTTYSTQAGAASYKDGKLYIKNYTASEYSSASFREQQFSDFALEVEMVLVSGSSANRQGVICRYSSEGDYYNLGISADGEYLIQKFVGGVATWLKSPTSSSHINTGSGVTNNVRVECMGNSLTLYVNGIRVAHITDNTLVSGYVGFLANSSSGEYTEVAFDNAVIWTP
jgi:hypothetical protein